MNLSGVFGPLFTLTLGATAVSAAFLLAAAFVPQYEYDHRKATRRLRWTLALAALCGLAFLLWGLSLKHKWAV